MRLTKENIVKRLRNWKTWVALFALVGLVLKSFGYVGFEGQLGDIQNIVYTFGTVFGIWSDHEGGEVR